MELFKYKDLFVRYYSEIFWKQDNKALLELLEDFHGTIVELGSADGRVLSFLANSGYSVIGIESQENFLQIAQTKLATYGQKKSASFIHANFINFKNYPTPSAVILWSNTASTLTESERLHLFANIAHNLPTGSRFLLWNATEIPIAYNQPERIINTPDGNLKVSNQCTEDFSSGIRRIFYNLEINNIKECSGGDTFIIPAKKIISELVSSGLKICKLYGNLDLTPWKEGKSPFVIIHAEVDR